MLLDDTVVAPDQVFKENLIFPILSTPWKIYLLLTIGTETVRFGTLRKALMSVSRVSVTKYLMELEKDGFLYRIEYPAPPLRTEYKLTPAGLRILPILQALTAQGNDLSDS